MRFHCVDTSGGTLRFSPERAWNIIVATTVLHNICIDNKVPDPEEIIVINDGNDFVYRGTLNVKTEDIWSKSDFKQHGFFFIISCITVLVWNV